MGPGPNDRGNSRHHLIAACEASLKRLRTDWIDLYQVHQWDGETPLEETMEALDHLVALRQGPLHRLLELLRLAHHEGARRIATGRAAPALRQPADPLHAAGARGGIRAGADLDRRGARHPGLEPDRRRPALSGKFRRGKKGPEGSRHFAGWKEPPIRDEETLYDIVDVLVEIADARGVSGARVALAWLLGRPGVTSVIIGGRNEKQFKDNLAAADLILTQEERQRLDKASELPLLYPYWHQMMSAKDRLSQADLALLSPYL